MQTILTKYLGPTNSRGSRIKARCWLASVTIPYPYGARRGIDTHKVAADALVGKMNKDRETKEYRTMWRIVSWGELPDGTGYAFIIDQEPVE